MRKRQFVSYLNMISKYIKQCNLAEKPGTSLLSKTDKVLAQQR